MQCPYCGSEVPVSRFCENCGNALPVEAPSLSEQEAIGQVPGQQARAPQEGWAHNPYQPQQAAPLPQAGAPVPPGAGYQGGPAQDKAPSTAFVLAIVGLVLSLLFVTWVPGLVLSIVALVLNAGYSKRGLVNDHKTSTLVLGVIGIAVGALVTVSVIMIGTMASKVIETWEDGVELEDIDISIGSDGVVVVTGKSGTGASSSAASSGAASPSSASGSAPSAASGAAGESRYVDGHGNATLYSLVELSGEELVARLEGSGYEWYAIADSWIAPDGNMLGVIGVDDLLSRDEVADLPKGAAGQPVMFTLVAEGYATPMQALHGLAGDVAVQEELEEDDVVFAVVRGSSAVDYLVIATETDDDERSFLIFTDEAIASGLFEEYIGVGAGSSIADVWKVIDVG